MAAPEPRSPERGSAMLLAMIVLTTLATLSGLTVVSVQGSLASASADRFHAMSVYAAESGGAAALDFLRKNISLQKGWSAFVSPSNVKPVSPVFPGNNVRPGQPGNLFSADTQGWYSVQLLNNRNDPSYALGQDGDARVIIRSTGYGPNGAVSVLEWEISGLSVTGLGRPCPGYGQRGMSEDGAGRNDCLGALNTSETATLQPGS
jgi:hypothetical protein